MENDLTINITAVDEASEVLDGVSSTAEGMSEVFDEAATSIDTALTGAEEAAVSSAQAIVDSFAEAGSEVETSMSTAAGVVEESYSAMVDSLASLGAQMDASQAASFAEVASLGEMSAGEVEAAYATAFGEVETEAGTAGTSAGRQMGAGFMTALAGLGLLDFLKNAITDFTTQAQALSQLGGSVASSFNNQGTAASGASVEIKDLSDKIAVLRGEYDVAAASLTRSTGTTLENNAAHAKASAEMSAYSDQIAQLTGKLDLLKNGTDLTGESQSQVAATLQNVARGAVSMGFNVSESASSLSELWLNTLDVNTAQQAFQDAMDLSTKANIPLAQATNAVIQAMQGNGKAIRDVGVQVTDGLSGQQALNAIMQTIGGTTTKDAAQGLLAYKQAGAQLNETMSDLGGTISPQAVAVVDAFTKMLKALDDFVSAHPRITAAILAIAGGLGLLLTAVGLLNVAIAIFGTIMSGPVIVGLLSWGASLATFVASIFAPFVAFVSETAIPALFAFGEAVLLPILPYILLGAAVIYFVALFVKYHQQIWDFMKEVWTALKNGWNDFTTWLGNFVSTELGKFNTDWNNFWGGIGNFVHGIVTGIENDLTGVVTMAENALKSLSKLPSNLVGGAVSGAASLLSNIPGFATGGIVNGPTLAMVGEAGPEAIIPLSAFNGGSGLGGGGSSGGGGNIIINLTGTFLSQSAAMQIANMIAQNVNRQTKLKTF